MEELIGKYIISYYAGDFIKHEIIDEHDKVVDGLWEEPFKHVTAVYLNEDIKKRQLEGFKNGAGLIVANKIDNFILSQPRYMRLINEIRNEGKTSVLHRTMDRSES